VADVKGPVVTVMYPTANAIIVTNPFSSFGKATDDNYVSDVQYRTIFNTSTGAWTSVSMLSNGNPKLATWTNSITLTPGTNIVQYKAIDLSGNFTTNPVTRKVFLSAPGVYTLNTNGLGGVTGVSVLGDNPGVSGAALKIGRNYTVTAVPGSNYLFTNWTVSVNGGATTVATSSNKYTFLMQSNVVLSANFITNRFIGAAGQYNGLFSDNLGVAHESSGWFQIKTDAKQKFTGKILVRGESVAISGAFDQSGAGTLKFKKTGYARKGLTNAQINVTLNLDLADGYSMTGTIVNGEGWSADMQGYKAVFNFTNNPATNFLGPNKSGLFTLIYPGSVSAATQPGGDGYALITVKSNGVVPATGGRSGDYQIFKSTATALSKDGDWPFYAPLYVTSRTPVTSDTAVPQKTYIGSVMGWLKFNNLNDNTVSGDLFWNKGGGWTNLTYYGDGFTNTVTIVGSSYTKVANTTNCLTQAAGGTAGGPIVLADGNLPESLTNIWFLSSINKIQVTNQFGQNTNGIKMSVATAKGEVSASFTNPANAPAKTVNFKGAVLQDQGEIRGVFLGTNQSGSFRMTQ